MTQETGHTLLVDPNLNAPEDDQIAAKIRKDANDGKLQGEDISSAAKKTDIESLSDAVQESGPKNLDKYNKESATIRNTSLTELDEENNPNYNIARQDLLEVKELFGETIFSFANVKKDEKKIPPTSKDRDHKKDKGNQINN